MLSTFDAFTAKKRAYLEAAMMLWGDKMSDRAWKILKTGKLTNSEFVLLCMRVDEHVLKAAREICSDIEEIFDKWQQTSETQSLIRVSEWSHTNTALAQHYPEQEKLIMERPAENRVKCFFLYYGDMAITYLTPRPLSVFEDPQYKS